MGDILNALNQKKAQLTLDKEYLQNAVSELQRINQQLTKINLIITKIEQGGWDA